MMRRWLPAVFVAVVALAGCTKQENANDTDRQRIEAMKGEPVVAGLDGVPREGAADGGDFASNSYSAYPISHARIASAAAAREQTAKIVDQLRAQGWTVISARCTPPAAESYSWEAFAYKVRGEVPYAVKMTAGYSADSGLTVNLTQQTPFHADKKVRFQPAPAALTQTCVERGDVANPDPPQGATWDLA